MIILNAMAQLAALAGVVIIQIAYSVAAARLLGVAEFGQFSFVFSVTQILLIGCDLGLHNTAVRKIAIDIASGRQSAAEETFGRFFSLKLVLSALLACCGAAMSFAIPNMDGSRLALVFFSAGMFFQALNTGLNIAFQAHGKLYLASINNVLAAAFNLGIATVFMLVGGHVVALGIAYTLGMSLAFSINCYVFGTKVHPVRLGGLHDWRNLALESLPVGIGTLFNTIASRIDITILTLIVGSYQTGIYSAPYRIYGSLLNIPIAIFSAVLPVMASLGEGREGVRRLFDRSLFTMIAIVLPLVFALSGFSGVLITLLYGKTYAASDDILKILAWSLIPAFVGMAFSHVILSQATLSRRLPAIGAAGMIANIGLNLLLIPRTGNRGAAVSTLLTEAIVAGLYAIGATDFLFGNAKMKEAGTLETLTRRAFGEPPSSKASPYRARASRPGERGQ